MEINELSRLAMEVRKLYDENQKSNGCKDWDVLINATGMVGDVGDLMKYLMAYQGYRTGDNIKEKVSHELCDVLWSLLVIAHKLDIDISTEFPKQMQGLKDRIDQNQTKITNH